MEIHNRKKRRKKHRVEDDGQVWSSYSDMFTTIAIVFLTMFVFAMIKVGVSTMERIAQKKAHEKELEGVVTEQVKKESRKRMKKLTDSIDQVSEYKDVINQKMKDLGKMVTKLESNKDVMQDIIEQQLRKEGMLQKAAKKLQKKKQELALKSSKNEQLQKELVTKEDLITKSVNNVSKLNEDIKKQQKEMKNVTEALKEEMQKQKDIEQKLKQTENTVETFAKQKEELKKNNQQVSIKLEDKLQEVQELKQEVTKIAQEKMEIVKDFLCI